MAIGWENKRILIVVKTYPTPAYKGGEVVCTAGITEEGRWIRVFPIPFRMLEEDKQFKKYQWIEARVRKASDPRPESYEIDIDSIEVLGKPLDTAKFWQSRKDIVFPLLSPSMCSLQTHRHEDKEPTLGIFKPKSIKRLVIEPSTTQWDAGELARLLQLTLVEKGTTLLQLERIPYNFLYEYVCEEPNCRGHRMTCTDWEMAQAYRSWSRPAWQKNGYGEKWEEAFRNRFEKEMIDRFDTHFFVGTLRGHPGSWIIVGLFRPLKPS